MRVRESTPAAPVTREHAAVGCVSSAGLIARFRLLSPQRALIGRSARHSAHHSGADQCDPKGMGMHPLQRDI